MSCVELQYKFAVVVKLAAQAGVRYSIINPDEYIGRYVVQYR